MATFPSLRSAAAYAGVSHEAIRNWSVAYGIGKFENGKWSISKEALDRVIAALDQIEEIKSSLSK